MVVIYYRFAMGRTTEYQKASLACSPNIKVQIAFENTGNIHFYVGISVMMKTSEFQTLV